MERYVKRNCWGWFEEFWLVWYVLIPLIVMANNHLDFVRFGVREGHKKWMNCMVCLIYAGRGYPLDHWKHQVGAQEKMSRLDILFRNITLEEIIMTNTQAYENPNMKNLQLWQAENGETDALFLRISQL